MTTHSRTQGARSFYTAAWQHAGPGILIVMMFVIVASAAMFREQTAVAAANMAGAGGGGLVFDREFNHLDLRRHLSTSHTVCLTLPLNQLRDSDGCMTPKGESLLLLLARRMKSLSLSVMLTANSMHDAEFAVTIAAHMLQDVTLESTQVRIRFEPLPPVDDASGDAVLTVTMTRHEEIDGDVQ